MKNILTLTLLMIPGVVSSMSVTGYSGGGVQVTCRYDEGYRANQKYFCKLQWSECKYIIKTKEKNKWVASGRFSLYDDTESAVFTVIIRGLREGDSGKYYCGTKRVAIDRTTEVNLEVITGQQIRTVRGYSGGNVIINYKMKHKNHVIDVCKSAADPCVPVITTNRRAEQDYNRRFSVHDDRSAGLVRLFIRDLTENDSGKYKITVTVSEDYSFFSEFDLDIQKDDCCVKSISLSASAGGSVNISCKYPQSHSGEVKFLCRRSGADLCAEEASVKESRRWTDEGKIQLYDDREQQLLTGSISHVTERDSEYWCGVQSDQGHQSFLTRVLITITETSSSPSSSAASFSSVKASPFTVSRNSTSLASLNTSGSSLIISLVLLVLIIAGLLLLFLWKKRQSPGGDSSSQTEPGKHEVVSHTGCDYEEIKDTHKQLPTTPSVSSNCVYATVETATGDSRCCITSAEDLNYAVVDFHKEPDCPDSVGFRNDQDFSEYAAVNHLTA